jgi:hypothetical protein
MSNRVRVWPPEGMRFRDPFSKTHIDPEEGMDVDADDSMIIKALANGDLVKEKPKARAKNALREVGTDQRKAQGVDSPTDSFVDGDDSEVHS